MEPEPLIQLAIEPTSADCERLATALKAIGRQMHLDVRVDHATGRIVLGGWSEEQLSGALALLHVKVPDGYSVGAPQVAYREGLVEPVELTYTHKRLADGSGEFGAAKVGLFPGEPGQGIHFVASINGGNLPREYILSVEKGMRETAATGSLFGFPLIDFSIELLDGKYHDVDSSALAFEIVGRGAMREGAQKSGIKLLEPIMKVEVVTPEEFMGEVIGDLNSRRGQVQGMSSRGNAQVVEAMVPLATMFGYVNKLRSLSHGRAQVTMQFSHYDEVPDGGGPPDSEPAAAALRV